MSVSQANGSAPHPSRRRRRGGSTRHYSGEAAVTVNVSAGRNGGANGSVGGGRGGGRRTIWEDKDKSTTERQIAANSNATLVDSSKETYPNDADIVATGKASAGGGGRGGGGRGAGAVSGVGGSGARRVRGVHPAMLESEFLAATEQADGGAEGAVASLSLEEVPYDRDLRWCNTASDSRPRPTMDTSAGVFGRVGVAIAQDTGDYERLDRHYQELWKDREENGPPAARGRGGRTGRGGRARGRGSGAGGRNTSVFRGTPATASGRGAAVDGAASRRESRAGGGADGRGARGGSQSPASKDSESPVSRGREGSVTAAEEATGGSGGWGSSAGNRKRTQRTVGNNKVMVGRGGGGGGGRGGAGRARGIPHSSPSPRTMQPALQSAYRIQRPSAACARQGLGGGSPAPALTNGRPGWEGGDQRQHEYVGTHTVGLRQGPWAMEAGSSRSPVTPPGAVMLDAVAATGTPPLVPLRPSLADRFPPDSPEYLDDLANALSSTPPPPKPPSGLRQPLAVTPPLGPTLLGSSIGMVRSDLLRDGAAAKQNGGLTLSPYVSPRRSTNPADIRVLADPSLDVDIQDICADADLNADAPAFVPGGYFPA